MAAHVAHDSFRLTAALLCLLVWLATGCAQAGGKEVVVYTSLDQPFSEPVLAEFERRTGIAVRAVYDAEAAKTTGLVSRLVAESGRPKCDVFWSSEYAQTILLKGKGILASYDSPSARDIPSGYRDPEAYWTGFAARARVILVNSRLVPPELYPKSISDLVDARWGEGEVGIANPLFGTTATHAAALFASLGTEPAQAFFEALLQQKVRVVDGNSVVRDMVASGELKVGLTDTDDAYGAVDRGQPVVVIFPDQDALGTLVIPNTVALVRGAPHESEAKLLVDFLLSVEVEGMLARSEARHMPVRPQVPFPSTTPDLATLRAMPVHPADVAAQMRTAAAWLSERFLR